MKFRLLKKYLQPLILLILLAWGSGSLFGQEENGEELTETERMRALAEEHKKTGVEFTFQYPLPVYLPGWSFESDTDQIGPFAITYLGTNISYMNINLGLDMDLGSRKKILKNMSAGISMELNILSPWHMEGKDAALFQYYTYLDYSRETKRLFDRFYRFGLGFATITNEQVFTSEQEQENPIGPLFVLETGTVYPPLGNFRLYSGFSYKFLPMNTKNIHILAPFIRGGYRL